MTIRTMTAIACAVLALGAASGAPVRAEVGAALRALDQGDDAKARAPLAAEIAELSYYQALAERGEARQAAAERAVALALEGSWTREAARALLAAEAENGAEAIAALGRATALAPGNARLWKLLGDAQQDADDRAGAKASYLSATALDPGHAGALVALGNILRAEGDFGSAYNAFNHAADEAGGSVEALIGRATASLYMGDRDRALADLERAVTLAAPGGDRYRALMGILYLHTYLRQLPQGIGRAEEAVNMWLELGRSDMAAAAINAVARLLLETGESEGAEGWYDRGWQAIQQSNLKPEERTIWQVRWLHGKARCAATRRDTVRANGLAAEAQALMAADPKNQEHYAWIGPYLTGYLALSQRRYAEAVVELQKSDLERPYILYLTAEAYGRAKDRANAELFYQRALKAATSLDAESAIVRPLASAWLAKNR